MRKLINITTSVGAVMAMSLGAIGIKVSKNNLNVETEEVVRKPLLKNNFKVDVLDLLENADTDRFQQKNYHLAVTSFDIGNK